MATIDSFERRLDDKNRLTIPPEVRKEFNGEAVVVTRGFGEYIHMYPKSVWDSKVEPALQTEDVLDERIADLNVQFRRGRAVTGLDDKQGRITLDQTLLDYAGIRRDIVAVRAGEYWRIMAA